MRLKNFIIGLQLILLAGMLPGCGNDADDKAEAKHDHFMKEQAELMDKAKAVEGMMQEHVRQEMREADEQSR